MDAIQDFSIVANAGEIHGIIGPNGAGKTTIFNTISGVYSPDKGQVFPNGQDITKSEQHKITRMGMGRTFQNIRLFKGLTVEENVMCAFDPQYGNNLKAFAAALSTVGMVGIDRIHELLTGVFDISVSAGSIQNWITQLASATKDAVEQIRERVRHLSVLKETAL